MAVQPVVRRLRTAPPSWWGKSLSACCLIAIDSRRLQHAQTTNAGAFRNWREVIQNGGFGTSSARLRLRRLPHWTSRVVHTDLKESGGMSLLKWVGGETEMCRLFALIVVLGTVALASSGADAACAGCKDHTARQNRTSAPPHLTIQPGRQGYTRPTPATRYAYGWFGVKSRHHYVRHFGYLRDFTQWTAR